MEKIIKKLFDFQKFEKNQKLSKLTEEAESEGELLSDEDLSFVNAAGEISHGVIEADSGNGPAGIGGGTAR